MVESKLSKDSGHAGTVSSERAAEQISDLFVVADRLGIAMLLARDATQASEVVRETRI
jgi:hypothetical protein